MATVAAVAGRLPAWVQARYGTASANIINWINDLLEELSGEPWLMKETRLETGVTVDNYRWIDPPSNCKDIQDIFDPEYPDRKYQWEEVNGRIKLVNASVEEASGPDTASTFANFTTTYIDVDISDAVEDEYKNYLFLITAGTYENIGYVIDSNDASAGGTCRLYFQHPLATALDATKVTAASLISYDNYVMLKYSAAYDSVSSSTDEVPIGDKYERRITKDWLEWKVYEEVDPNLPQTKAAELKFRRTILKLKRERRSSTGGKRVRARYIPGLMQYADKDIDRVNYEEEL